MNDTKTHKKMDEDMISTSVTWKFEVVIYLSDLKTVKIVLKMTKQSRHMR